MNFTKGFSIFFTIMVLACLQPASADIGLEVKGGTLGVGAGLVVGAGSHANIRLGASQYEISEEFTEDGLEYKGDFKPDNKYLLLDLMPFQNGNFRLTVGTVKNDNQILASATVVSSVNIGNTPISSGTVDVVVSFDSSVKYFGIGWGNAFRKDKRIGFTIDIGLLDQGSPDASIAVTNLPSGIVIPPAEIAGEEADIEKEVEDFDQYPVLMIGLTYRF